LADKERALAMDRGVGVPAAMGLAAGQGAADREAATAREHMLAADFNRAKWRQDQMHGQRRDSTKAALSQVSAETQLVTLPLALMAAV